MEKISGNSEHCSVENFHFYIKNAVTHAILCSNVTFLDDLLNILLKEELLSSGRITVDNRDFFDDSIYKNVQFLSSYNVLYTDMTVADNIFFLDKQPFLPLSGKINQKRMDYLAAETGFRFNTSTVVRYLTSEQKKIIEILKCYYENPKILIVRELSNLLTFNNFTLFLGILDKLKQKGAMILYLTSQWEEAFKVADIVTIVSRGKNCGTHPISEIKDNPAQIYYLIMGGESLQKSKPEQNEEIEMLRRLNNNVYDLSSGHDLQKTLHGFVQYLAKKVKASNCVIYLINDKQESAIDIVVNMTSDKNESCVNLRPEIITNLIREGVNVIFSDYEPDFPEKFVSKPNCLMVLACPIIMSSTVAGLIQIDYSDYFEYTEYDKQLLNWIIKEIAIVVENSRLMGRSVLLQESYHRIKNNLQIIISLMEMEKDALTAIIKEPDNLDIVSSILDNIIYRVKSIAKVHNLMAQEKVIDRVIDMYTIINEVCHMYDENAKIVLDFDRVYVPYSKAVSVALVINELINNSIKHNHKSDLQIMLTEKEDKQMQKVVLTCRDNGKGFPGNELSVKNYGIGIMVVQSIVSHEFRGKIRFFNDNGAVVEIEIPLKSFLAIK